MHRKHFLNMCHKYLYFLNVKFTLECTFNLVEAGFFNSPQYKTRRSTEISNCIFFTITQVLRSTSEDDVSGTQTIGTTRQFKKTQNDRQANLKIPFCWTQQTLKHVNDMKLNFHCMLKFYLRAFCRDRFLHTVHHMKTDFCNRFLSDASIFISLFKTKFKHFNQLSCILR